jgi:aminoglycoside phosphotransferase (APT) family kinase protein
VLVSRPGDVDPAAIDAIVRRVFGGGTATERTADGVSSVVYRVRRGPETFYLRVAETADEDLATDATMFRHLRELGVRVPEIIHVERDARIGRSVAVMTEIPGAPTWSEPAVLADAGADLARINRVPVDGFGWIRRRGDRWPLAAEYPSYEQFLVSDHPDPWPGPLAAHFPTAAIDALENLIDEARGSAPAGGHLAHGDFDGAHIFGVGTRYTGLIDFGEIRGTEPMYDLGQFHLYDDGDRAVLTHVLYGYRRIAPPEHPDSIRRSAILLGLGQLCRWLGPARDLGADHPFVTRRTARINALLRG